MNRRRFTGVKIISYYNIIMSILFIIGSVIILSFSITTQIGHEKFTFIPLIIFILFCSFCIFSSKKFLGKQKIGRILLLWCCIIQVVLSCGNIIISYKLDDKLYMTNAVMLLVASWGVWYLNSHEAKEWTTLIKTKSGQD